MQHRPKISQTINIKNTQNTRHMLKYHSVIVVIFNTPDVIDPKG